MTCAETRPFQRGNDDFFQHSQTRRMGWEFLQIQRYVRYVCMGVSENSGTFGNTHIHENHKIQLTVGKYSSPTRRMWDWLGGHMMTSATN